MLRRFALAILVLSPILLGCSRTPEKADVVPIQSPAPDAQAVRAQGVPRSEPTETTPQSEAAPAGDRMVASLDAGVSLDGSDYRIIPYTRLLDRLEGKYTESRMRLCDIAVTMQSELAKKGVEVTVWRALGSLDEAVPSDAGVRVSAADFAAAIVTMSGR